MSREKLSQLNYLVDLIILFAKDLNQFNISLFKDRSLTREMYGCMMSS